MFTEFLVIITTLIGIYWYLEERKIRSPKGKRLPGPSISLPFLGSALSLAFSTKTRNYEIFEELCDQYGPLVGFKAGREYIVLLSDIELAKFIMSQEEYSSRTPPRKFMMERSFNKNLGLIWSWGDSWKEMRKYTNRIMKTFGFGKVASMETFIMDEIVYFMNHIDEIRKENNDIVLIDQIFNIPALNLLWSMLTGERISYDNKIFVELAKAADEMKDAVKPGVSPYVAFPFLRYIPGLTEHDLIMSCHKRMHNLFKEIIDERRAKGKYLEDPEDFFDVFIKEVDTKKPSDPKAQIYTEEQMIMVCADLVFATMDTLSSVLGFSVIYLMNNPRVVDQLREELNRVVGQRLPNLDDKSSMHYVEATTLEIFRWASVNPVGARVPNKDSLLNGYFIPKNTIVAIQFHAIHFNENLWGPTVNEFRPERFLDEKMNIINSEKVFAFGYGKRNCIGENFARAAFFIFLTSLIQRYDFVRSPSHPEPMLQPRTGLTNTPYAYHILVKKRQQVD